MCHVTKPAAARGKLRQNRAEVYRCTGALAAPASQACRRSSVAALRIACAVVLFAGLGSIAHAQVTFTGADAPAPAAVSPGNAPSHVAAIDAASRVASPFASSANTVDFGHLPFGSTVGVMRALHFTIAGGTTVGAVEAYTTGARNLDFSVVSGAQCTSGGADAACTVNVQFLPAAPGLRSGALVFYDATSPAHVLASVALYGGADAPVAVLAPHPASVVYSDEAPPSSLALDGAGNLYIGGGAGGLLAKLPAGGGAPSLVNVAGESFAAVPSIAVDGAGNLFIADVANSRIEVLTPSGNVSTLMVSELKDPLNGPASLAFDAAGNLYIADAGNSRIVRVSSLAVDGVTAFGAGEVVATGDFALGNVSGVAVDPSGNLYIADAVNDRVLVVAPAGGTSVLALPGLDMGLSHPAGIAVDGMGNIYIADAGNERLVEVTTTGVASVVSMVGTPGADAVASPGALAVDAFGNIYVADVGNSRVIQIPVSGAALEFPRTRVGVASTWLTATITNLGNLPLEFAAHPPDPADFSEHSGDPNLCTVSTTLSAGSACDVAVEFTPQSTGNLSGTLTRNNNSLNLAHNSVLVAVTGLAAGSPDTTNTAVSVTPSSVTIGQTVTITATVTDTTTGDTAQIPTGQVILTDTVGSTITSLNGGLGVNLNSAGQAILTGVLLQGAGTHTITAVYGGISNTYLGSTGTGSAGLSLASATLALHLIAAVAYGQTGSVAVAASGPYSSIPPPSGTLAFSIMNASNTQVSSGTLSLTPAATTSSATVPVLGSLAPGSYTVEVTYGGDGNYQSISTPVTLPVTMNKGFPSISISPSLNPVLTQNLVTFTVSVASGSSLGGVAAPTGTVNFYDGQTQLNVAPIAVAQGAVVYATSALAVGPHSISATYGGDSNYATTNSSVVPELVIDFTLSISVPTGQGTTPTVLPGGTQNYSLEVTPSRGANFPSAVTFGVSGLPPGATATFTPPTIAAGTPVTTVNLAVLVSQQVASHVPVGPFSGKLLATLLGSLLLLAWGIKWRRPAMRFRKVALLTLAGAAAACLALGLAGCASSQNGYFGRAEQTYTMTVTATSGSLAHSSTVMLTVE